MAHTPGGGLKAFLERRGGKKAAKSSKPPGAKAASLLKGKCKMCTKMGKKCPECAGKLAGKKY